MGLTINHSVMKNNLTLVSTMLVAPSTGNVTPIVWCPVNNNTDDSYLHFLETAQFITGLIVYPCFCFPGMVGNILTVIVLSRRDMLTSTNAFLSALAVSDSIKLINDTLYFFVILFLRIDPLLGNLAYGYLYPYAHFVFNMSVCVSSWLTVSVAVERYILVCMPTKARAVWSRRRAVVLCTLVYFVMTSLALPSAFRYRTIHCLDRDTNVSRLDVELTELWMSHSFVVTYTWAQNLLRSIIPLIILVVLNTCIIYALSHTKARRRRNSRHRVTIMMIVVILAFLICITPDAILSTVFGFGYHEASNLTRAIREITDTLLTINAAINFLIYCAFNQVFRKSFAQLCRSPKRRESNGGVGWVTEMDESTYRRLSEAQSSINSKGNCSPRIVTTPVRFPSESSPIYKASDTSSTKLPGGDGSCCDNGGDAAKVYDSHQQKQGQFQKFISNGGSQQHDDDARNAFDYDRAMREQQLCEQAEQQRRHVHDPRRTSSHGLKKSKNSLKRGRNARRSTTLQKIGNPVDIVTYISPDLPSASSRFRRRCPAPIPALATQVSNISTTSSQQDDNADTGSSDIPPSSTSPTHTPSPTFPEHIANINDSKMSNNVCNNLDSLPQNETDSNANRTPSNSNHIGASDANRPAPCNSNHIDKSAFHSDNPYRLLVHKEPWEESLANENVTRNNEMRSTLYKDNMVQDDRKVDAKHLNNNVNMINNDLTSINPSLNSKNTPLKESNILSSKRGVREKKKVTLAVSFSDESSL